MRVLTAAQSRDLDRWAIEELQIASRLLMENAVLGVLDALFQVAPDTERVALLCGPGNNGGDGLALARQLVARSYEVSVGLVRGRATVSEDARAQLQTLRAIEEVAVGLSITELQEDSEVDAWFDRLAPIDLLVDGLFGTGLSRPLSGCFERAVVRAGALEVPILAIDLPSGLDADSPEPVGPYLPARWTVTFETPKLAHVLPPAEREVGEVIVTSLGLPPAGRPENGLSIEWLTHSDVAACLPPRPSRGHKGTFGHLFCIAGSLGKSGAAILAARAAMRSGAGLVTVVTPNPCVSLVESGSTESMTLGLPATDGGEFSAAAGGAWPGDAAASTLLLGPGLGTGSEVVECIRGWALGSDRPVVLDADALNAFAGSAERIGERAGETVLTPHPGEIARLLGTGVPRTASERLAAVRTAASQTQAVVVLKGYRSLIADPSGRLAICPTGNHGLATGGSGDVLAGMVAALLASGANAWDAAGAAVYLHGLAADLYVESRSPESLTASELIDHLGVAWDTVRNVEF